MRKREREREREKEGESMCVCASQCLRAACVSVSVSQSLSLLHLCCVSSLLLFLSLLLPCSIFLSPACTQIDRDRDRQSEGASAWLRARGQARIVPIGDAPGARVAANRVVRTQYCVYACTDLSVYTPPMDRSGESSS